MTEAPRGPIAPARPRAAWSPGQYLRFTDHRLRPALDLLAQVRIEDPAVIWDLGCGPGNVTGLIADRWPGARVHGLDGSAEMLAKARATPGRIRWVEADLGTWVPGEAPDLLFSNAALHWLGDHATLFPRLLGFVKPGGCLAVQMPLSWGMPSHRLIRETLAECAAAGRALGTETFRRTVGRKWVEDAGVYHDLLVGAASRLDIWETEYLQVLEGEDPVLEWVRGSALRPVLEGLDDEDRAAFLETYRARLREAYPARPDGRTLYPFRRLFIVAAR